MDPRSEVGSHPNSFSLHIPLKNLSGELHKTPWEKNFFAVKLLKNFCFSIKPVINQGKRKSHAGSIVCAIQQIIEIKLQQIKAYLINDSEIWKNNLKKKYLKVEVTF